MHMDTFLWLRMECLFDKLRHNAVLDSPKPILTRGTWFVEY
ncbi:hypothetical protein SAMN05216564_103373 [Halopenitus persicus]|uniref:Uncharacterized protein n=1 Tax=Halopenitus persicus TaxID=1048396 RepID=A0A1H3HRP7_9EURY|nr:hypothetical protein SAMN05216564_103373 [Halopenitus persicus]